MSIPVFQPFLSNSELQACKEALDCKYLGMGSFVGELENKLADFLNLKNNKNLLLFSTGHAALHLALMSLNISNGDEVITPSFNNIADLQAISAVGANPVFCDIELDSLCIDPYEIEKLITNKTKAIIVLDYAAKLAKHKIIKEIGKKHSIPVIHDAAHSFGSKIEGEFIGNQHELTMMSFDPIKNITCIDGGALIFKEESLIQNLKEMRMIGMSQNSNINYQDKRDWNYDVFQLGYRYHMPNLHASIGLSQLNKLPIIKKKRREIYSTYYQRLNIHEEIKLQGKLNEETIPFIFCIRLLKYERRDFREFLKKLGIETGIHWRPGHRFAYYLNSKKGDLSNTEIIEDQIVSLPFYPSLSIEEVNFICDKISLYIESRS